MFFLICFSFLFPLISAIVKAKECFSDKKKWNWERDLNRPVEMGRKKNSPSKASPKKGTPSKSKKGGAKEDHEGSKHILGSEVSEKIAEMYANSLKILRDPCGRCGRRGKPSEKFLHAAVSPLDQKNRPIPSMVYVVRCEHLRYSRQVVWGLENNGEERVSFHVLFLLNHLFFLMITVYFFQLLNYWFHERKITQFFSA